MKNSYKITENGPLRNSEIISEGFKNIWIVKVMRADEAGSFKEFCGKFSGTYINSGDLSIEIDDFEHGKMSMDWENGFRVEKEEKVFLRV